MKSSELKQLIKEEIISILSEDVNYTPGGFMGDEKKPWKSLPPGKYEITYTVLDPSSDKKTYMLDLPDGKEFKSYDEATDFYMDKYRELKKPTTLEDRWRSLIHVEKVN